MKEFERITQHLIMEKDLNDQGNLFGGLVLMWIDEAVAMYTAQKIGYANIVTVALDNVNFESPGYKGDHLQIYAKVIHIGSSSIKMAAEVLAVNPETMLQRKIICCEITFVCIGKDKKPYPYFKTHPRGIEIKKQWEELSS